MLNLNEKRVEGLERILTLASEMLSIAKKRNALLRESFEQERDFYKTKEAYNKMIGDVEDFFSNEAVRVKKSTAFEDAAIFLESLKEDLREIEREAAPFLEKGKEAVELTNEIETYIEEISKFVREGISLKLEMHEYEKHIYEMVVLVFVANSENHRINEDNFFTSKEDFYELLRRSKDPVLISLLENKLEEGITKRNHIYSFLDEVV